MRLRPVAAAVALSVAGTLLVASPSQAASRVSALTLLDQLKVSAESSSGYARTKFGGWVDANHDGQDTRAEVLISESRSTVTFTSSTHRTVKTGRWVSGYDRKTFTAASKLDIDHMVPLAEAWGSGAKTWSASTRKAYANDLGYASSLVAVSAASNRSKSDRDPARWLPPSKAYRCAYVSSWVAVKWRWSLNVDKAEKAAATATLKGCSTSSRLVAKPAKATIVRAATSSTAPPSRLDPRFATCTAATAAGYGPYVQGRDPEYAWYIDRDHDGVVCE
ncbi:excalibur calcium-binding domain-containing protein [Cellulomonas alba]|uniref:Excalibur calcium-binding domain-containing protein n=1 Tax=Cellulomonas alba TaxID=3053467 RepID=A0ABT7SEE6_9CELL|nr:excalibur calcium-binding domain-containing protein [Cellulomonas alba]MDM7854563.1 excalibur calcium-binding domain-containing protein [Cellulomonas alba]